MKNKTF